MQTGCVRVKRDPEGPTRHHVTLRTVHVALLARRVRGTVDTSDPEDMAPSTRRSLWFRFDGRGSGEVEEGEDVAFDYQVGLFGDFD